jgi:predicted nucleotidyltransferase component of viral defense system
MGQTRLSEWLVFKGGTALKKVYFPNYRFSGDLDFTLREKVAWEPIQAEWVRLGSRVRERSGVGIEFLARDPDTHANTHTFYLGLRGPIPRATSDRVKVDITLRELMYHPIEERPLLREYPEYEDLEEATVSSYSIEEIAAEKVMALVDRARNEPRDLYDLWYLAENSGVVWPELVDCLAKKYRFRGVDPGAMVDSYRDKERRLRSLWTGRLEQQIAILPRFDEVYRDLRRRLRPGELMREVVSRFARLAV